MNCPSLLLVPVRLARALSVALMAGCAGPGDPVYPAERQTLAAQYIATTFTTETNDGTRDVLAAGGSLVLYLGPSGSTGGRLVIPATSPDSDAADVYFSGLWTLTGDTVRFTHAQDTFLRDMPFVVQRNDLAGDRAFDAMRVRVTLRRS